MNFTIDGRSYTILACAIPHRVIVAAMGEPDLHWLVPPDLWPDDQMGHAARQGHSCTVVLPRSMVDVAISIRFKQATEKLT